MFFARRHLLAALALVIAVVGVPPAPAQLEDPRLIATSVLDVSFQPEGSAAPGAGWAQDHGFAFSETRGYGWVLPDGNQRQCGDRDQIADQVDDTFCHATTRYVLNGTWQAISSPASWQASLPNGEYEVSVSVGESQFHAPSIIVLIKP